MPPAPVRRAADAFLVLTAASIPLSTTGMEVGVIALGGLGIVAVLGGWRVVRRTPLDGVLAVFFGTLAVSTLASGHPLQGTGWARLWIVLAYFTVFWWLRDGAHAARLARVCVLAGAVAAAYGIVQHFTGIDWYRALLGRPSMVRARELGATGYAVVGFFRNYLTFAHTMIFPLGWGAAGALAGDLLGIVAAPVLVAAIVFSTARGAWLAMLAAAAGLVVLARGGRVAVAVAALAAVACVAFAVTPDLRAEAAQMFTRGPTNAGRLGIYAANLDIIHDRPIFGLGFGRYQRAALPYYAAHPAADRHSHAHNNFLQIAAESGLAGLAAFGLLYATALRRGWEAVRRVADTEAWPAAAGAYAGVLGFLVGGLTQYTFGDAEVAIAMWVALAVLMRCRESGAPGSGA
jgi:O-antigen ligase